jgi:hypothetical protein
LIPAVRLNHAALLVADHWQPAPVERFKLPVLARADKEIEVDAAAKEQLDWVGT